MPGSKAGPAAPGDRIAGIALFLPVPLVLLLFTRMPFGVDASLAAGLALMLTHPLYARPWALHSAGRRCLWCGGAARGSASASGAPALSVSDPRGTARWRACSPAHLDSLAATLRFAERGARPLRAGILGTVTAALAAMVLAERGWLGPLRAADASAFFRLGVALAVLPMGWLGPRQAHEPAPGRPLTAPFPLHLPALIGVNAVLWLFRLVGLVWLAQGAFYFAERLL